MPTKTSSKKQSKQEIVTKVINITIYILGGAFLAIYITIFAMEIAQSTGNPIFGYQFYNIGSGSMYPKDICDSPNYIETDNTACLSIGTKILVQTTDNYDVGDVITFTEDNGQNFTTHRIVSINDDIIITKGDANSGEDDPIRLSNIMGKMIKKASFVQFFLDIKYPALAILAAIILISLFIKK